MERSVGAPDSRRIQTRVTRWPRHSPYVEPKSIRTQQLSWLDADGLWSAESRDCRFYPGCGDQGPAILVALSQVLGHAQLLGGASVPVKGKDCRSWFGQGGYDNESTG